MTDSPAPVDLGAIAGDGGVVWSSPSRGFHANLVVLGPDQSIAAHRNDALDVLVVVLDGTATIAVDDRTYDIDGGSALLVPRGAVRSIAAGGAQVRYLTVHGERSGLGVGRKEPDA